MSDHNEQKAGQHSQERDERKEGASGDESKSEPKSGESVGKSGFSMESMRDYLARSLGIKDNPPCILEDLTLKGIAKYLASDKCKNVITMAGAGISTSAGIPDFRSPGTGLYDNLASYNLPHPQAIFEMDFFRENPKPFFVLAKELYPGSFKPTICHYFIKLLSDKGKLLRHYTQNIDTLERVAGLDPDKLIEAHGTFHTSHCLKCRQIYTQEWMKDQIFADKVPRCEREDCNGVVKPDIVFFGESLPAHFAHAVSTDFKKCDLLIVTGTSLMVQPFASLTNRVPAETPRLYINLEKGEFSSNPMAMLFFGPGFNFDGEDNYRDVFKEATCDDGCQELADLLGWGDELKEMVKTEHAIIDKETAAQAAASDKVSKSKDTDSKAVKTKATSPLQSVKSSSTTKSPSPKASKSPATAARPSKSGGSGTQSSKKGAKGD